MLDGFKRLKVAKVFCTKCGSQPLEVCKNVKGVAHKERYARAEYQEQMDLRDAERRRNATERLS